MKAPWTLRLLAALACALVCTRAPLGAGAREDAFRTFRFDLDGRTVQIPSMIVAAPGPGGKSEYISLKGTAAALGGKAEAVKPKGSFRMDMRGETVRFSPEYPSIVTWDGRIISLSGDARPAGNDLFLPTDFLTRVIDPILTKGAGGAVGGTGASIHLPATMPAIDRPAAGDPEIVPTLPDVLTVVIDPGHGGTEMGAEGRTGVVEKEVTLDIAMRLKALLEAEPGLSVLLTRHSDSAVGLDERTALANRAKADLFVSIHVNSSPKGGARGAETFFLSSQAKDEEIRTLAAIENDASGIGTESLGSDPQNLQLVLWDLAQAQYLQESSALAEVIQTQLNEALGIRNRGVKQAPFRVLMGATMPAVLVEVGFLTNPDEEKSLKSGEYRDKIAAALSSAVLTFRTDVQRRLAGAPPAR